MAVMYTHSVFLRSLLIFVLLDVTRGIGSSMKGHFSRKDFPGDQKFNSREGINNTKSGQLNDRFQVQSDEKTNDIFEDLIGQTGTTVVLPCDTRKLVSPGTVNVTVIWIKLYNGGFIILTEGKRVLTADKRFLASNKTDPQDWSLHIRYAKKDDAGLYKCQICSESNFNNSIFVKLKLTEAWAEIIGPPVREVEKVGSPLRLSCELKNSIEPPKYIFWYRGDRVINYDRYDGASVRQGSQGSELIFPRAQEVHTGNYSCVPSNARPASVMVIVNAKISDPTNNKSGGKESHPRGLAINMLVMVSIFLVYR